jgi:hypothetical protein
LGSKPANNSQKKKASPHISQFFGGFAHMMPRYIAWFTLLFDKPTTKECKMLKHQLDLQGFSMDKLTLQRGQNKNG